MKINTPLSKKTIMLLKCGDQIAINGTIYTARDAAHKKIVEMIDNPPFDLEGQIIYYVGPTPPRPGQVIGAAGPTTSNRMDSYTPALLERGLGGMIGKGSRDKKVIEAMIKNNCVYFSAIGGAGALLSKHITAAKVIAFPELGPEAIFKLEVKDFPVIVAIDCKGNNIYNH